MITRWKEGGGMGEKVKGFKLPFNLAEYIFKPIELERVKHFKIHIDITKRKFDIFILNSGLVFHSVFWEDTSVS